MYHTRLFPLDMHDPATADAITAWLDEVRQLGQRERFALGQLHTVPIAPVPPCDRPVPGVLVILRTVPF